MVNFFVNSIAYSFVERKLLVFQIVSKPRRLRALRRAWRSTSKELDEPVELLTN